MTKSWPLLALAILGASATVFCLAAFDWMAWTCNVPGSEPSKPFGLGPGACIEFWLYRYQTLIGAVVAMLAAGAAWFAVQQQVAIARAQLDAATGNVDPQFVLVKAPMYDRFVLWVHNLNSNALVIDRVILLTPRSMICEAQYRREAGPLREIGSQKSENTIDMNLRVPGTAPSAADVSQIEMHLTTTLSGSIPVGEGIEALSIARFAIYYRTMNPDQSRHRIDVACDYIPDDGENV